MRWSWRQDDEADLIDAVRTALFCARHAQPTSTKYVLQVPSIEDYLKISRTEAFLASNSKLRTVTTLANIAKEKGLFDEKPAEDKLFARILARLSRRAKRQ